MRILFVNHTSSLTGAPISCLQTMTRLGEGFVPFFAASEKGPVMDELERSGIRCFIVKGRGILGLKLITAFITILKSEKIDVIHLNTLTPFCKYAGIAGFLCRVPVAWFVRENPLISRSRRLRFWLKLISSKTVFVDEDTRRKLLPGAREDVEVIYNGVDTERFKPVKSSFLFEKFDLEPRHRLIGYLGLITKRKGLEYLIRSLPILKKDRAHVKLILIGGYKAGEESYYLAIKSLIREMSLEEDIYFTGALSDVVDALNSLDLVALPSLEERCSRSLLESLACAKAVVATRVGGTPEIVHDGQNGILVDPADEQQLAAAFLKLLNDDALRLKMGAEGRLRAKRLFDIRTTINKTERVYLNL